MFTRSIAPALSRAFLSTFFVFAILSPTAAQLPEPARDTLVVGIQDESGPYELVVANNFVGFNVDILREVGERVGVAFSFVRDDYDKLKRYLADGDIDLILMDYGPEPGSRDTVSRTLAYNSMELAIFASVYQLFNPDDFGQYELVTDREAFVRAFAQMPRGGKCVNIEGRRRRDMLRGHVSQQRKYLLLPSNIGAFLVDNYQIEDVWSIPFKGPAVSYSMAFRMADSSLAAAFDIALRQSIVGTGYSKAKNKWFGMLPAVASKP